MARTYRQHGNTYFAYYLKGALRLALYVALAVIGLFLTYYIHFAALVLLLPLFMIPKELGHFEAMKAGMLGENVTDEILEGLPHYYHVLRDVTIRKQNGFNQLDHIVVGKKGIFVVETKYYSGAVKGRDKDVKILQKKRVKGSVYSSRFLNPAKQVTNHVVAVKRYLKLTEWKNVPVYGIVFFSHPDARVKVRSKEVRVFSARKRGAKRLVRHIKWRRSDRRLSRKEINAVSDLLRRA